MAGVDTLERSSRFATSGEPLASDAEPQRGGPTGAGAFGHLQFLATAAEDEKQSIYKFHHVLLGEFEVLANLEEGVAVEASAGGVAVRSSSGITVVSRGGLPTITLWGAYLGADGEVRIDATPEVGRFEEQVLGEILRATVLKDVSVAGTLATVPRRGGELLLLDGKTADVLVSPAVNVAAELAHGRLRLRFVPPVFIDVLGKAWPINLHIGEIFYDFATADLEIKTGAKRGLTRFFERPVANLAEGIGMSYVRRLLPAAMLAPGYDPFQDPELAAHLAAISANARQGGDVASQARPAPVLDATAAAPTSTSTSTATPTPQESPAAPASLAPPASTTVASPSPSPPSPSSTPSPSPSREIQVLYDMKVGDLALSLAIEAGDAVSYAKSGQRVTLGAACGLFLVAEGVPGLASHRIYELQYDIEQQQLAVQTSPPLGAWTLAALQTLVVAKVAHAPPHVLKMAALGPEAPTAPDGRELLSQVPLGGGQVLRISLAVGDRLEASRGDRTICVSAAHGIRAEMLSMPWMPPVEIARAELDLTTGAVALVGLTARDQPGALSESFLAGVLWLPLANLVPELPVPVLPDAEGNMLFQDESPKGQRIDISARPGDELDIAVGRHGINLRSKNGVLVRMHKQSAHMRLFALSVDFDTDEVVLETFPAAGPMEQAIATAAFREFAKRHVDDALAAYDKVPSDQEAVLYQGPVGDQGTVSICMEDRDQIALHQDAKGLALAIEHGLYWRASGKLGALLPKKSRIYRIALDFDTGRVTIDGDKDPGPFLESVATAALQAHVLPKLAPELRSKLFGGEDPTRPIALPKKGAVVLYEGKVGGVPIDISLANGWFSLASLPGGQLAADAAGRGLVARLPSLGVAIAIDRLTFDPRTGAFHTFVATPALGSFERDLVNRAANQYLVPLLVGHLPAAAAQARAQTQGERIVYETEDVELRVAEADALALAHTPDQTVLSADHGIRIRGRYLGVMPIVKRIAYDHHTGAIDLDMVTGSSAGDGEVMETVATEELLAAMIRRAMAPQLSPLAGALGLRATGANTPLAFRYATTPWFEQDVPGLGRLVVPSHREDTVKVVASNRGVSVEIHPHLELHFVDLGVVRHISKVGYVDASGELFVEGLNDVEAAMLQGALPLLVHKLAPDAKRAGRLFDAIDSLDKNGIGRATVALPGEGGGASPGNLVFDPTGRVELEVREGAWLEVQFVPPVRLEASADFTIAGLRYGIERGEFSLDVDGEWIGEFFERRVTSSFHEAFLKILPEAMKQPGYNLILDPNRVATIAALRANLTPP